MFDPIKFLQDHNISFVTEGKNVSEGWINIKCPFHKDPSEHLGFRLTGEENLFCWSCGNVNLKRTIGALLDITANNAVRQIIKYSTGDTSKVRIKPKEDIERPLVVKLPFNAKSMTDHHKNYLITRGFNPYELERDWGLMGTNHLGDYKFRIVAPVWRDNRLVTYQCRDITNKASVPYLACPDGESIINIKQTLYGIDAMKGKKRCIVVEGITDAWRMGLGVAVGTFGMSFSQTAPHQLKLLSEQNFEEIFILFDNEDAAQERAQSIMTNIIPYLNWNCKIENVELHQASDPAELKPDMVSSILKELGF
jgi:5S rRNA maturation endonuclease (ribonuclease M5)